MNFRSAAEARSFGTPLVRLFVTALARSPGWAELAPMLDRLRAGAGLADAAVALAASPEFLARHGPPGPPDRHYVRALFWAIDGQDPPDAEFDRLLALPGASRASLLAGISQSAAAQAPITLERHLYHGALRPDDDVAYQLWLETGGEAALRFDGAIPDTTISLVVTATAARPDLLEETLASLGAQTSPHWEALVPGDTPRPPGVTDQRVQFVGGTDASWAGSCTRAASLATGSLVGFIEAGDRLAPQALEAAARRCATHPGIRLIYTDEDSIAGDGTRSAPLLKGGWSPDLLLAGDAIGGSVLFQRQALLAAGGFRPDAGAFGLLDAALRLIYDAGPGEVAHLPGILLHRGRARSARPAPFPRSRTGIGMAGLDAVVDRFLAEHRPHLRRGSRTQGGRPWPSVTAMPPGPWPRVSVIIPTGGAAPLLDSCLSALLHDTDYPNLDVLVIGCGAPALERWAADPRVQVLHDAGPFHWSALSGKAASRATGEILLLLGDDVVAAAPDWLRSLAGHVMRPGVGVVGARLLSPGGRLQHAGLLLGPGGAAVSPMAGAAADEPGYLAQAMLLRDVSAVTGTCLAIRRSVFHELGGVAQGPLHPEWGGIDLCLRARAAGYRVLWNPDATLTRHGTAAPGGGTDIGHQPRYEVERAAMQQRWPGAFERDPYLNPALRADPAMMVLRPLPPPTDAACGAMAAAQREIATLQQALHRSEQRADRMHGLWPRAELQRLHLENAELRATAARLAAHPAAPAGTRTEMAAWMPRIARPVQRAVQAAQLLGRIAGLVRRTPQRRVLLRQRRADYAVIAGSPVFDRAWYRAAAMAGDRRTDPVAHYLWQGALAGQDPHPLFDAAWYAARTPELAGEDPFAHYLRRGMAADRAPHPLFDTAYYLAQAPEAAGRALLHYATRQDGDTRSPAPLFDPLDYPEGLAHWVRTGAAQGRDPHALFTAGWYRRTHMGGDPAANPLVHWLQEGRAAGLPANPHGLDPSGPTRFPALHPAPAASVIVAAGATPMDTTRTLASIAQHGGAGFEVILLSPQPALRYGEGLRTAADRTAAVAAARGRHLVFLGGGTVAQADWLQCLVETADADTGAGMVGCQTLLAGSAALRSAGAVITEDGQIRQDDASLPFCRPVDAVDPDAMLVRRAAWEAVGGISPEYRDSLVAAADLAFSLRAAGWRVLLQPASRVMVPHGAEPAGATDARRFRDRWAAALPAQPAAGDPLPGWRAAARRVLVLAGGLPVDGSPEAVAVGGMLRPGLRVALHPTTTGAPGLAAAWERRGLEIVGAPATLDDWLAAHGPLLDEVWSFLPPSQVPQAALLRWTGAPLRVWQPGDPLAGYDTPPDAGRPVDQVAA